MIVFQAEENPILTIALIGRMGRGKTNFMRYMATHLAGHGYKNYYLSAPRPRELPSILEGLAGAGERLAIFVDDISFMYYGRDQAVLEAENFIARIRHRLGTGDSGHIVLTMAFHYHRSVNPFLRMTDVVLLFDLTSKHEVQAYSEIFTKPMLYEYKRLYSAYRWHDKRLLRIMKKRGLEPSKWRPVLAKIVDREFIAWIPYTPEAPWEEIASSTAAAGNGQRAKPPFTFRDFAAAARERGIRARDSKLLALYHWVMERFGIEIEPAIKPAEEEEEAPKTREEPALAPA